MNEPTAGFAVRAEGRVTHVAVTRNTLDCVCRLTELDERTAPNQLRVDLGRVHDLGPVALSGLVRLSRRMDESGGHLVLHNVRPLLHRLLRLTGLAEVLDARPA